MKKEIKKPAPKIVASKVELVSFSLKAVIPVGEYANIQPEIEVKAKTLQEAKDYVMPFIAEMFDTYRYKLPTSKETITVKEAINMDIKAQNEAKKQAQTPQKEVVTPGSPAFEKAKKAVENAMSRDALDILSKRIMASENFVGNEKDRLMVVVISKIKDIK